MIENHHKIPLDMRQTQRNPAVLPNFVVSDIIGVDPPRQPMSSNDLIVAPRDPPWSRHPHTNLDPNTPGQRESDLSGTPADTIGRGDTNQTWLAGKSSEKKNPNGANGKIVYKGGFSSKPRLITRGYAFSNSERCRFWENELSLGSGV